MGDLKEMAVKGSDTIRCDFAGIGAALLKEVCHCRGEFRGLLAQASLSVTLGAHPLPVACKPRYRTFEYFSSTMSEACHPVAP